MNIEETRNALHDVETKAYDLCDALTKLSMASNEVLETSEYRFQIFDLISKLKEDYNNAAITHFNQQK